MSGRLNVIQYIRGIAAIMVLLFHLEYQLPALLSNEHLHISLFKFFGYSGVDFFFIISGFVIWISAEAAEVTPRSFIIKRLLRIYPPYIIALTVYFLAAHPVQLSNYQLLDYIKMYLLLPYPLLEHVMGVSWTLTYEMIFYITLALFLVFKLSARTKFLILAGYCTLNLSINIYGSVAGVHPQLLVITYIPALNHINQLLLTYLISPFWCEFFSGIVLARIWLRFRHTPFEHLPGFYQWLLKLRYLILLALLGVSFGVYFSPLNLLMDFTQRILFFMPVYFLILLLAILDEKKTPERYTNKFMIECGNASYMIYLLHMLYFSPLNYEKTYWGIINNLNVLGLVIIYGYIFMLILITIQISKYMEMPLYHWLAKKLVR